MPVETASFFSQVIEDHVELKRRNSAIERALPIDRYVNGDPFENHPLFKTEEQARIEETMGGERAGCRRAHAAVARRGAHRGRGQSSGVAPATSTGATERPGGRPLRPGLAAAEPPAERLTPLAAAAVALGRIRILSFGPQAPRLGERRRERITRAVARQQPRATVEDRPSFTHSPAIAVGTLVHG